MPFKKAPDSSLTALQITPVAPQCLEQLSKLLLAVCKNPNVPEFNHFLFESVAALIKSTAAAEPKTVATLEEVLFPPFQIVLAEDVQVEQKPQVLSPAAEKSADGRGSPVLCAGIPSICLPDLQPADRSSACPIAGILPGTSAAAADACAVGAARKHSCPSSPDERLPLEGNPRNCGAKPACGALPEPLSCASKELKQWRLEEDQCRGC